MAPSRGALAHSAFASLPAISWRQFCSSPAQDAWWGLLRDHLFVVNALKKEQLLRGVPVARIDEDGSGVVGVHVRQDKEAFEFTFPRTLPGERLHLRVGFAKQDRYKRRKAPGSYRLLLEQRGAASPNEVVPVCEHFKEKCGGCAFQNLAYDAQLREKRQLLLLRLREYRIVGGEELLQDVVPSPSLFGFHGRTEFRFFLRDGPRMGLHPSGSPIPIPISHCRLHPDASQRAFQATLRAVRAEPEGIVFDERTGRGWLCSAIFRCAVRGSGQVSPMDRGEVLVTLVTIASAPRDTATRIAAAIAEGCDEVVGVTWSTEGGEPAVRASGWRSSGQSAQEALFGRAFLPHSTCGVALQAAPEAFSRQNVLLEDAICRTVSDLAELKDEDVLWDAFCGQGLLSLPSLAGRCRRLVALDRSEPALEALRRNLASRGLEAKAETRNVDLGSPRELLALPLVSGGNLLEALRAEDSGSEEEEEPQGPPETCGDTGGAAARSQPALMWPDVLLADPGRNGLPKAFRRFLIDLQVRNLVYVSSGRALLRDLALLTKRGYQLGALVPFDNGPHTPRLEVVAQLRWVGTSEQTSGDDGDLDAQQWPPR